MASASNLPDFNSIVQRGAVTEPRASGGRRKREEDNEISLNAAVASARRERKSKLLPNNKYSDITPGRPKPVNLKPLNLKLEDSVFSSDSSMEPARRHHTPSTLARTKFTAATPAEEKRSIMELKQRLDFNREEDASVPAEEAEQNPTLNNKSNQVGFDVGIDFQDHASVSSITDSMGAIESNVGSEISENVDVNKIVIRLTQVREYLKQATSMYTSLTSSDAAEPSKGAQLEKLATLIQQLRIQEQGYIDLLQRTLVVDNASEMTDITRSGSHLSLDDQREESRHSQMDQLESLQQQQQLMKKIIEQQKQLSELKKRQSALLAMQSQAERLMNETESEMKAKPGVVELSSSRQNNKARDPGAHATDRKQKAKNRSTSDNSKDTKMESKGIVMERKVQLEQDLEALSQKKVEMEGLISALKTLRDSQKAEADMLGVLGLEEKLPLPEQGQGQRGRDQDPLSGYYSETASEESQTVGKLKKLTEVRDRLDELRRILSQYEQMEGVDASQGTSRDNRLVALNRPPVAPHSTQHCPPSGGTRPKDPNRGLRIQNKTKGDETEKTLAGYTNNRRNKVPSQTTSLSMGTNWNPDLDNEKISRPEGAHTIESKNVNFSLTTKPENTDLLSKIDQLQEARERLTSFQVASSLGVSNGFDNIRDLGKVKFSAEGKPIGWHMTRETDGDSVSSRSTSINDLDWQDDPELVEKIKKLQIAKEKLKKLQDLVSVIQQDTMPSLPISDLLELSLNTNHLDSSKAESADEETDTKKDSDADDQSELRSDVSEQQSETSLAGEEEGDDDDADDDNDGASDSAILNNQGQSAVRYSHEVVYQEKLKQQRQELEQLLKERQKLIEVQQQLSELTQKSVKVIGEQAQAGATGSAPRPAVDATKSKPSQVQEKNASNDGFTKGISSLPPRDNYRLGGARPKLVKRPSNMSVEPQIGSRGGSEVDYSPRHSRSVDTLPAAPLPNNPLVVSELRRQRDMFEQKKKQRFAEKHQMRQISDNASEGGTFSIRSDIDEGVGVSMMSADVTTATWGGSTEQSSTEEDSAVGEDEEREMDGAYGQAEEEEEEEEEDASERVGGNRGIFRRKNAPKKGTRRSKVMARWSDSDKPVGKKRKLNNKKEDFVRPSGTVSWAMNLSPSEPRRRPRQQNLTPAHRLMRDDSDLQGTPDSVIWEQQCQHLYQQLTSNTSLTGSLLRNQQTLLSMLQGQMAPASRQHGSLLEPMTNASDSVSGRRTDPSQQGFVDRFNRLVHAMNSCQNQLLSQQLEMRLLQSQCQSLVSSEVMSGASESNPWPVPSPLNLSNNVVTGQAYNSLFATTHQSYQGGSKDSPLPAVGVQLREQTPYPGKARKRLTQEMNTQTETSLFDEQFHVQSHDYSLFGEQQGDRNQAKEKTSQTNFSPFRFYQTGEQSSDQTGNHPCGDDRQTRIKIEAPEQSVAHGTLYNPLVYSDVYSNPVVSTSMKTSTNEVITTSSATPMKSMAMATLAGRQKSIWPSFLAQSTERPENASDGSSMYSSSYPGRKNSTDGINQIGKEDKEGKGDERNDKCSDATSNFSLFEALRDSIYSEVATLISMNESRPHYLIELFRELQLLTSDYLRQRALYALQDLVTRYLTDENLVSDDNAQQNINYKHWTVSASEHTPSESVVTTDDEEQKALEALSSQIRNNEIYDYAEIVETGSTLSTPTSSVDHPFARDQLGDTVINLDEALQKMKMYEENMVQTRMALGNLKLGDTSSGAHLALEARKKLKQAIDAMSNSSAGDFESEASSDVPQTSVDTQKLDKQIKAVVMELVPFFNERTEVTVTSEFLEEMKDLILRLARQREPSSDQEEFGRFFHKQLESILHDSLIKFTGKKLNDCGEDIITDVSEILFNELAFFKLMQDLDRTPRRNHGAAWSDAGRVPVSGKSYYDQASGHDNAVATDGQDLILQDYETSETSSVAQDVQLVNGLDEETERTEGSDANQDMNEQGDQPDSIRSDSEDEAESSRQYVNLELSVSESRPVNSTGSGEEDLEEDQPTFPAGRSSASFHQESPQLYNDADESQTESQGENEDTRPESEEAQEDQGQAHVDDEPEQEYNRLPAEEDERDENRRDMEELARQESEDDTAHVDEEVEGAVGGDVGANGSNNTHELDVDDAEITLDDFPIKLTGLTEADLQARMASEQSQNESASALLSNFDGIDGLAADVIREPGQTANGYPEE